jgi:hypothetical protein
VTEVQREQLIGRRGFNRYVTAFLDRWAAMLNTSRLELDEATAALACSDEFPPRRESHF